MVHLSSDACEEYKTCTKCNKQLHRGYFYKKGKFWDSRCKACILVGKKEGYSSAKKSQPESFKSIFIVPFETKIDAGINDLLEVLGAFLMEEFDGGQTKRTL